MNEEPNPKKSRVGIDLVRLLAAEGNRIFSTERARELGPRVGLKDAYLLESLHHLGRNGWIVPIRRGVYALASSVPGVAPTHEFEIAMALVAPAALSHWSALHYHGLTEQVPRTVFVLTTTGGAIPRARGVKGDPNRPGIRIGDTRYQFIRVRPERYFGSMKVWIGDARVEFTDPERTLLDGLMKPQFCGDFAEVLRAFEMRVAALDLEKIVEYALRLDTATAKRLGWVLDRLGFRSAKLDRLVALPVKGYRNLDPTGERQGPYNRRWMIRVNLSGRVTSAAAVG